MPSGHCAPSWDHRGRSSFVANNSDPFRRCFAPSDRLRFRTARGVVDAHACRVVDEDGALKLTAPVPDVHQKKPVRFRVGGIERLDELNLFGIKPCSLSVVARSARDWSGLSGFGVAGLRPLGVSVNACHSVLPYCRTVVLSYSRAPFILPVQLPCPMPNSQPPTLKPPPRSPLRG